MQNISGNIIGKILGPNKLKVDRCSKNKKNKEPVEHYYMQNKPDKKGIEIESEHCGYPNKKTHCYVKREYVK